MSHSIFQKLYVSHAGRILLYGVPFGIMITVFTALRNDISSPITLAIGGLMGGLFFGIGMDIATSRQHKYFIESAKAGKLSRTRRFGKLFRKNQLPEDTAEYPEYREFLEHSRATLTSIRWYYPIGYVLFGTLAALSLYVDDQPSAQTGIFVLILVMNILQYVINRKNLEKIDQQLAAVK